MKVLLRKRIRKLGTIGDVVEVKPGYARNYLLPYGIAMIPSEINLKRIEKEKEAYLAQLAREKEELRDKAELISGKEVTITARANETGHLYGSIGPAQIAYAMNEIGISISPNEIKLSEPIQQLDRYDVTVELEEDITATIHVWIVAMHEPGMEDEQVSSTDDAGKDESSKGADSIPEEES